MISYHLRVKTRVYRHYMASQGFDEILYRFAQAILPLKTIQNTINKHSKNTPEYHPTPSNNTPRVAPKSLIVSFFLSGDGIGPNKLG